MRNGNLKEQHEPKTICISLCSVYGFNKKLFSFFNAIRQFTCRMSPKLNILIYGNPLFFIYIYVFCRSFKLGHFHTCFFKVRTVLLSVPVITPICPSLLSSYRYLSLKNVSAANACFSGYLASHPLVQVDSPPFSLPLFNFLFFLLKAAER